MNKKQKKMLLRILIAAALMILLHFIPVTGYIRFLLYLVPYLVIGYEILTRISEVAVPVPSQRRWVNT